MAICSNFKYQVDNKSNFRIPKESKKGLVIFVKRKSMKKLLN